jgi:hypothetical protein
LPETTDPVPKGAVPDPPPADTDPPPTIEARHRLLRAATPVAQVVAAWGTNRMVRPERVDQIRALLQPLNLPLMCLGTTQAGHPKHPLYLPGSTPLIPFETRTR